MVQRKPAVPFDALVVFAKEPLPGKVKTRMGKVLGHGRAARLYGLFLRYLSARLRKLPGGLRLFIAADPPRSQAKILRCFRGARPRAFAQRGRDLGNRMLNATRDAQKRGARKVLLIGSDCLELSPSHLRMALALLEKKDLVLGPSRDGGYYLVGWKKPLPACFKGVAWSTPSVLRRTLRNAGRAGFTAGLLPVLSDLDEARDLKGLGRRLDYSNPWAQVLGAAVREGLRDSR